jgi:UDPglucose--hexose-1-phosphate uridylyltransferase
MEALFQKRKSESVLLDFTSEFKEKSIPLEVRTDLFTGCVSRILKFRNKLPESRPDNDAIEKSKSTCPFCPGHRDLFTPKFPPSIAPEGRIQFGNAVVLPNAFPYSRYCGVTLFSDEHFLSLDRFTPQMLHDAFQAGVMYIDRVKASDPEVKTASINWNYLMSAGGGLYHPHLQVVVNRQPSHFHQHLMDQSRAYGLESGKNYWQGLLAYEKKLQERYLFSEGKIEFLSVFSPKGMFGEVLALFTGMTSLTAIGDAEWAAFQNGLSRILRSFHRMNLNSLNMTLLLNLSPCEDFEIQARITPRMSMPPWGTSDVNYFEKGHNEIIVVLPPETLGEEIRNSG